MGEKRCTKCGETKPLDEFHRKRGGKYGRGGQCKSCRRVHDNEYRSQLRAREQLPELPERKRCPSCSQSLPATEFNRSRSNVSGLSGLCKRCHRDGQLRRLYGISLNEFEAMLASQGERCALCGADEPGGWQKQWHVDHDHATGVVRGLLCHACNTAIGLLKESPMLLASAVVYLSGGRIVHAQQEQSPRLVA